MNPNIAQLARQPRGKPYQSRLDRFTNEIRSWRAAKTSYRQIAIHLAELGLVVSAAAVHSYVRVRDVGRTRRQYVLPEPVLAPAANAKSFVEATSPSTSTSALTVAPGRVPTSRKKYVFQAKPDRQVRLSAEQLQINNPLL